MRAERKSDAWNDQTDAVRELDSIFDVMVVLIVPSRSCFVSSTSYFRLTCVISFICVY